MAGLRDQGQWMLASRVLADATSKLQGMARLVSAHASHQDYGSPPGSIPEKVAKNETARAPRFCKFSSISTQKTQKSKLTSSFFTSFSLEWTLADSRNEDLAQRLITVVLVESIGTSYVILQSHTLSHGVSLHGLELVASQWTRTVASRFLTKHWFPY